MSLPSFSEINRLSGDEILARARALARRWLAEEADTEVAEDENDDLDICKYFHVLDLRIKS